MKFVVGLGNPGSKYALTRHNAGCIVLDMIRDHFDWTFPLFQKQFGSDITYGPVRKRKVTGAYPQSYMNKSGGPISKMLSFYKGKSKNLLVIQDDIDIPAGALKLKFSGSHGGHNGVRDTIDKLGTSDFWRLKIGVGRPSDPRIDVSDFVLGKFTDEELERIRLQKKEILELFEKWLEHVG